MKWGFVCLLCFILIHPSLFSRVYWNITIQTEWDPHAVPQQKWAHWACCTMRMGRCFYGIMRIWSWTNVAANDSHGLFVSWLGVKAQIWSAKATKSWKWKKETLNLKTGGKKLFDTYHCTLCDSGSSWCRGKIRICENWGGKVIEEEPCYVKMWWNTIFTTGFWRFLNVCKEYMRTLFPSSIL